MNTLLLFAFLPNLFFSCMVAIEYIRPYKGSNRIPAFILFVLLGMILSFMAQILLLIVLWIIDRKATNMDNMLYDDQEKEDANQTQKETEKAQMEAYHQRKSNHLKKNIVAATLIGIFIAPLFFHFFPSRMRIVAKDYPTFRRTIVTQSDINDVVNNANEGSFFGRVGAMQDPFFRLLVEEKIIWEKGGEAERQD